MNIPIKYKPISKIQEPPLWKLIKNIVIVVALLLLIYMAYSVKNTEAHNSMPRLSEVGRTNIIKNTQEIEPQEEEETKRKESTQTEQKEQEEVILEQITIKEKTVEEIIYEAADNYGADRKEMYCLAYAESNLDPEATGYNQDAVRSIDRGLFQLNGYWHPEVTDAQAYDAEFSANWTAEKLAQGGHSAWYGFNSPKYYQCIYN